MKHYSPSSKYDAHDNAPVFVIDFSLQFLLLEYSLVMVGFLRNLSVKGIGTSPFRDFFCQ